MLWFPWILNTLEVCFEQEKVLSRDTFAVSWMGINVWPVLSALLSTVLPLLELSSQFN